MFQFRNTSTNKYLKEAFEKKADVMLRFSKLKDYGEHLLIGNHTAINNLPLAKR